MGRNSLGSFAQGFLRAAFWTPFCLLITCGSFQMMALDPARSIYQYSHDEVARRISLPGTAVEALSQSPDGYLWIQSAGALFRFDGVRFVPMPLIRRIDSFKTEEDSLRAMGRAKDGGPLLRTASQTLKLLGGRLVEAIPPLPVPDGKDRVVLEARDGTVWIGTDNHIFRVRDGRMELIAKGVGWVHHAIEDHEGSIWIAASSALYRYRQGRLLSLASNQTRDAVTYLPQEALPAGLEGNVFPNTPLRLMEDRQGVIWIGTGSGLKKWQNGNLVQDSDTASFGPPTVQALCQDRDGNIWAGTTESGLMRLTQGKWSKLTNLDGLSDNNVLALLEDREGDLWIGTRSGLDQLRNAPMQTISQRDGLLDDSICTVAEGQDGSLYVQGQGNSMARFKDGAIQTYTAEDGLRKAGGGSLYVARDNTIWVGSTQGLCALRNGRWQIYTGDGKLLQRAIPAITEDDEGLILASSEEKRYRFKDGRLTPYNLRVNRTEEIRYVFAMLRDDAGTLWFGTNAGLLRLDRNKPPEQAVRTAMTDPAISLYDDGLGYLWITGRDTNSFVRLNKQDGSLVRYTPEAGAPHGGVGRVLSDASNNLWMNTRKGIVTYSRAEVDAFAAGRIKTIHATTYTTLDGLRADDCVGKDHQPSAWRTRDGRLAFSSPRGLVLVDPARLPRNPLPPPVHIEEVLVDNVIQSGSTPLVFAPGQKNVEIRYTATSLQIPSRVHFKYKLEGYDHDWIEAGNRRVAYYTKLPPGRFTFRVIAANNDGVWNNEGASTAMRQLPRFYQTAWFIFLAVLALGGGVIGLHRFRVRMHIRAERALQVKIAQALAEIKALHGLLPICAWCKKIRDDSGDWKEMEEYITDHSRAEFSHGICPDCKQGFSRSLSTEDSQGPGEPST